MLRFGKSGNRAGFVSASASIAYQRRSFTRRELIDRILLTIVSLGMALVPAAFYWREQNFLAHAVAGHGTVVRITIAPTSQRGSNYTYTPTIRFADAAGQVWTVVSRAPGPAILRGRAGTSGALRRA